jgi:hypothetical protein
MPGMALIVFIRGVNVGGHRTFRPSIVARELSDYDVLNVGAAGTFVVRKPGSRAKFRTALLRKLPFEAEIVLCDGRDLMRLETENRLFYETVELGQATGERTPLLGYGAPHLSARGTSTLLNNALLSARFRVADRSGVRTVLLLPSRGTLATA